MKKYTVYTLFIPYAVNVQSKNDDKTDKRKHKLQKKTQATKR